MADMRTREPPRASAEHSSHTSAGEPSAFKFGQAHDEESIPALVRRLAEEGSHLAQQQVKLVEAEVRSGIADLKQSAAAMAGAAVLGLAGLGVVLMGLSYLLAEIMPLWAATLIVGMATLAGAYAMFAAGQKKLQSSAFDMDRTKRTLERAPSAISGQKDRTHAR